MVNAGVSLQALMTFLGHVSGSCCVENNSFPYWEGFGSFEDAHAHCHRFFNWYNDDHRNSGIGFHTPADMHYGWAELIRAQRGQVLNAAYVAHLERLVRKAPQPPALPTVAWINEPKEDETTAQ